MTSAHITFLIFAMPLLVLVFPIIYMNFDKRQKFLGRRVLNLGIFRFFLIHYRYENYTEREARSIKAQKKKIKKDEKNSKTISVLALIIQIVNQVIVLSYITIFIVLFFIQNIKLEWVFALMIILIWPYTICLFAWMAIREDKYEKQEKDYGQKQEEIFIYTDDDFVNTQRDEKPCIKDSDTFDTFDDE